MSLYKRVHFDYVLNIYIAQLSHTRSARLFTHLKNTSLKMSRLLPGYSTGILDGSR